MNTLNYPLTNGQIELMRLFRSNLSDADLADLKKSILNFFAEKGINAANELWDEKGLSNDGMNSLLNQHI